MRTSPPVSGSNSATPSATSGLFWTTVGSAKSNPFGSHVSANGNLRTSISLILSNMAMAWEHINCSMGGGKNRRQDRRAALKELTGDTRQKDRAPGQRYGESSPLPVPRTDKQSGSHRRRSFARLA